MPFTCACFCGLNGFCRRQKKKRRDQAAEEEGEEEEQRRDEETEVWQQCRQFNTPGYSLLTEPRSSRNDLDKVPSDCFWDSKGLSGKLALIKMWNDIGMSLEIHYPFSRIFQWSPNSAFDAFCAALPWRLIWIFISPGPFTSSLTCLCQINLVKTSAKWESVE